jgi:hypothetical protein
MTLLFDLGLLKGGLRFSKATTEFRAEPFNLKPHWRERIEQ